ncbi:hypothetical protein HC031_13595, partial [Planosporangium thailandense]
MQYLLAMPRRGFKALVRLIVVGLVTAVAGVTTVAMSSAPAWASHFRAAELSWSRSSANDRMVVFSMTESFRRDFNGWLAYTPSGGGTARNPNVGDVVRDQNTVVYFGDGAVANPYLLVTTVDAANNTLTVEALNGTSPTSGHLQHLYPSASGSWTAYVSGCCRLGSPTDNPPAGHLNNPDKSTRINSLVNLGSGGLSSVSSSLPPIVDCPRNSPCNFTIPASLPAGTTASYRLSSPTEASDTANWPPSQYGGSAFTQPSGAAVSASGLFTWNTTGQRLASAPLDTYYSAQVTVTALTEQGTSASSVAVDFFLRITNQTNNPPTWVAPTVADGSVIDATPGTPVTVSVAASDPDSGSTVTLGVLNKPADATFTTSGTNPATGTFTWTPTAVGDTVLNFTAADQFGLQAIQRSITINANKKAPTLVWPAPASVVYGTALDDTQLNAGLSTADGTLTPPHAG